MGDEEPKSNGFVWPPGGRQPPSTGEAPAPRGDEAERRRWRESLATWWAAVEHEWLGVVREPWARRAAAAGWSPDEFGAHCWRCASTVGEFEADAMPEAGRSVARGTGCAACRERALEWDRAVRLGEYVGVLREAVLEVKFERWRELGETLGEQLGAALARRLEIEGVAPASAVLVPVPMSWLRRMSRGVDHTLAIARGVARATGGRIEEALFRRHGPSQVVVPPGARWTNVAGSFGVHTGADLRGGAVVVIDDVRTTGATMTAACRALRRGWPGGAGMRSTPLVWSCVVSVASNDRRKTGFGAS